MCRSKSRNTLCAPFLALSVAFAAPGCASDRSGQEPGVPYPVLEGADFGGMQNVSQCGQVWVGTRPGRNDLELAVRRGVQLVIDATAPGALDMGELRRAAVSLGLQYVAIGSESVVLQNADVDRFLETIETVGQEPVLVFCDNGGRSAQLLAIFRVIHDGVPLRDALEDARRSGMKPGADEDFVRGQVARLSV